MEATASAPSSYFVSHASSNGTCHDGCDVLGAWPHDEQTTAIHYCSALSYSDKALSSFTESMCSTELSQIIIRYMTTLMNHQIPSSTWCSTCAALRSKAAFNKDQSWFMLQVHDDSPCCPPGVWCNTRRWVCWGGHHQGGWRGEVAHSCRSDRSSRASCHLWHSSSGHQRKSSSKARSAA